MVSMEEAEHEEDLWRQSSGEGKKKIVVHYKERIFPDDFSCCSAVQAAASIVETVFYVFIGKALRKYFGASLVFPWPAWKMVQQPE